MIEGYKFAKWLIINEDGEWAGLRDDAPPEAVEAYNEAVRLNEYDPDTEMITNY
jgi:hypothetical protein